MNAIGRIAALGAVAGLPLLALACANSTPTTPTQTPAAPTATEHYAGTLTVGSSGFYSFSVSQYGTVNVTLGRVTGVDDPAVMLGLALGVPTGFGCSGNGITTSAGSDPQITNLFAPGVYCVRLSDVGNLTGPAQFDVTIAHP